MEPSDSQRSVMMSLAGAVIVSILGLAIHNALELGPGSLLDLASGFIPMLVIEGALLLIATHSAGARRIASIFLLGLGLLHLIGGAIISVLPLSFLPFVPEQSLAHYTAHVVYGVLQLPLIVISARQLRRG